MKRPSGGEVMTTTTQATQAAAVFARHWWQACQDRPATLMEAFELAHLSGADFDGLVAAGTIVVEGGMVRLARTAHKAPDAPRDRAEVLTDTKTPYSATGEQGDATQQDGAGYKGPEKRAEGRETKGGGKTPLRQADGQSGGYGASEEGAR